MSDRDGIRPEIIKRYGGIAARKEDCGCNPSGCCGSPGLDVKRRAARIGYSEADLESVPDGSNMGLGCGNPQAIADLKPGEIVLDLGAGGGIDCFLAAKRVGEDGRVIGVDMTPEMVERSRRFAREECYTNVDFRLGEIENLPVADASVDVIMSNCVVNLSPDKERVYREAFRVLKPGGRLAVSDTVRTGDMPGEWKENPDLHCACISGAAGADEIRRMLSDAGFTNIEIRLRSESGGFIRDWLPGSGAENVVASAEITALKSAEN